MIVIVLIHLSMGQHMFYVGTLASECTAGATSQPEGMFEEYNRIHPDRITGKPGILFRPILYRNCLAKDPPTSPIILAEGAQLH
ncbi:hypothetical protein N7519_011070 [Penicillium mononematosum]|uniref:uncharacterized protein n=1 Tax=Penicillium mononematosum TaxID=268346 RepID=UPI0025476950|nr:uncharacterized protein N7519_011070 [Penicillium mononematosum]KAJ6180609.1 hypothetical protein N7519_011070 [Penicillium mononematosum]